MAKERQDDWARWVLERQFGNDPERQRAGLDSIEAVQTLRDRVLKHAAISEGDIVLDVGCGSGLIAFGALPAVGERGRVIFSDVSQELLDRCHDLARERGVLDRCSFVCASADDLAPLADASVDVVTTRSVLIYVKAKDAAFREFSRVLRPGGRLSIFEPINRFAVPEPEGIFWGRDATPVWDVASKVRALYLRLQPPGSDPMLDFDERDLLRLAEEARFGEIHLELEAFVKPTKPRPWEEVSRIPGNPKIPSLEEAMREVLTTQEAERLTAYLRPLVEGGKGVSRLAVAYLWAIKHPSNNRIANQPSEPFEETSPTSIGEP